VARPESLEQARLPRGNHLAEGVRIGAMVSALLAQYMAFASGCSECLVGVASIRKRRFVTSTADITVRNRNRFSAKTSLAVNP
jgi:hypothetical protein